MVWHNVGSAGDVEVKIGNDRSSLKVSAKELKHRYLIIFLSESTQPQSEHVICRTIGVVAIMKLQIFVFKF